MSLIDNLRAVVEPLTATIGMLGKRIDRLSKTKIDIEPGKTLTTNDYTTEEKDKLARIPIDSLLTFDQQELTQTQQSQVRENIGSVGSWGELFYKIDKYRNSILSGTPKVKEFNTSSWNGRAYCVTIDTNFYYLFAPNYYKNWNGANDINRNPDVNREDHNRIRHSIGVGSNVGVYFGSSLNCHEGKIKKASETVRYFGNGYLYDSSLENTGETFCFTNDVNGNACVYSQTRNWPGLSTTTIREWGFYYNDVAYCVLDSKYIGSTFLDVDPTQAGKVPMVQADASWGLADIPTIVEESIEQAKSSGEFNGPQGEQGPKGDTPVKGVDYFTETDKQEIVGMVLDDIESSAQIHTLTDTITGQKYRLSVENGKLTMTEVTE